MRYSVKIFSRIGELIQGILPDGSHFLVSGLPSRRFFSEAILEGVAACEGASAMEGASATPILQLPPKANRALQLFLDTYQPDPGHEQYPGGAHHRGHRPDPTRALHTKNLRLHSNIPPGKGLSSSSADILSVLNVVNDYLGAGCSDPQLYAIAARVEPTDPCLSEDIVVFHQRRGIACRRISLPPVSMIWFDAAPDRQIDTVDLQRNYDGQAPAFFAALLDRFEAAAGQEDYTALFDCMTHSALYNQSVIPLPRFEEYYQLATRTGAGLMVAHSGTIIGLLSRPEECAALLPVIEAMTNKDQPTTLYIEQYSSTESKALCQER